MSGKDPNRNSQLWTKPPTPPPGAYHPRRESVADGSSRRPNPGRRVAQIVKLKPEALEQYKEAHAKVWPDVVLQIKVCNIRDYSIFYDDKSSTLFASFKYVGYDFEGDMERMSENPKVREWWAMTDGWQESLVPGAVSSEAREPSWWKPLEEVFYQA